MKPELTGEKEKQGTLVRVLFFASEFFNTVSAQPTVQPPKLMAALGSYSRLTVLELSRVTIAAVSLLAAL